MLSLAVLEAIAAVKVIARGDFNRYSARGVPETEKFEQELAAKFGVNHALALNSGTSALICGLVGAGVGPGDEVLVPSYTWVSTAAAVVAVGAVPVLVDIDASLTMDPVDLERKITPATRAIIPVHMLNLVCDMDSIMGLAEKHSLVVMEDASQAFGVMYKGKRTGTIGHIGAFSFNQHKNIKSGEGGALVTNDDRIFARASMYHDVGSYEREHQFEFDEPLLPGVNYRMPELSAAILRPQLRRLDSQLAVRKKHRRILTDAIANRGYACEIAPHNDAANAVGIAIVFKDENQAAEFGQTRGARRLIDTGRHIYANWQPIVNQRFVHSAMNAYEWANRPMDYSHDSVPHTWDILSRTCTVELAPEIPTLAYKLLMKKIAGSRKSQAPGGVSTVSTER